MFCEFDHERSEELTDPDSDLGELHQRFKEIDRDRKTSDDVTRALWFYLQAFSGAEQEIEEVKNLIDAIGDLSIASTRELSHGEDDDPKRREKAIYRLLRLGLIHDYAVDFGARKFIIHSNPFDFERCRQRLTDYVRQATPGKSQGFVRRTSQINAEEPRAAALALARMLIEFTYDEIGGSRRRSIREAARLGRQARSDSEIRRRLLDYLQEGPSRGAH